MGARPLQLPTCLLNSSRERQNTSASYARPCDPLSPRAASEVPIAPELHHFTWHQSCRTAESIPLWHYTVGTCPAGDASPWMHAPCISVISPKPCVLHPPHGASPTAGLPALPAPYSSVLRKACLSLTHRYILGTNPGTQHMLSKHGPAPPALGTTVSSLCYLEPRSRINHWVAWEEEGEIKRTMVGKGTRGKAAELCGWGPERLAG